MSKKTILVLVATIGFLAVSVFSTVFFVATRNGVHASGGSPTTVHLAFSGLVTGGKAKGAVIAGGLTEVVQTTGYFNGNLHLPDGTQISTSGQLDDGKITISFYNAMGAPVVKGEGQYQKKTGDYVGRFQVFYKDDKVDSGIWSALPVTNTNEVLALAFAGVGTKGPHENTTYVGAIVLNEDTLVGTLNAPNGSVIPLTAKIGEHGVLKVFIHLTNDDEIVGSGSPIDKDRDRGYEGAFTGPNAKDVGKWVAYYFGF